MVKQEIQTIRFYNKRTLSDGINLQFTIFDYNGERICRGAQMKNIDIKRLSKTYTVRKLNLDDVQMIYAFVRKIHCIMNIVEKNFLLN